jgi:hypothetical protein
MLSKEEVQTKIDDLANTSAGLKLIVHSTEAKTNLIRANTLISRARSFLERNALWKALDLHAEACAYIEAAAEYHKKSNKR